MTSLAARPDDATAIERVFREVYGLAVATLIRIFGDITLAEDAVQDAFVVASDRWRTGIPPNRAIAIGEIQGPGAALSTIDVIAPDLDNDHLMHAARGTALSRLGRRVAAKVAFERAADLATTDRDRRFLREKIEELAEGAEVT